MHFPARLKKMIAIDDSKRARKGASLRLETELKQTEGRLQQRQNDPVTKHGQPENEHRKDECEER